MRVVFDTVILVRGLIGPYSLWGEIIFAYGHAYELIASPEIVVEYLDVIERPRIAQKYRSVLGRDIATMRDIISRATLIHPPQVSGVCRDPADDKFLAAALTGDAESIVTEDLDLLDLVSYQGIAICPAQEFMRRLDEGLRWSGL